MLEEWLQPILTWLGIGLIPLLLIVVIILLFVKGD